MELGMITGEKINFICTTRYVSPSGILLMNL